MGYYTRYKIKSASMGDARCDASNASDFMKALSDVAAFGFTDHSVEYFNRNTDAMKWYEHDTDIAKAMIASGCVRVVLHGEGEEQGDVWDKTFTLVDGSVSIKTTKYKLVPEEA